MNYFSRIQKSIDYIENNLKEDISLKDVSEQAFSSVPHFYRILFFGVSKVIVVIVVSVCHQYPEFP